MWSSVPELRGLFGVGSVLLDRIGRCPRLSSTGLSEHAEAAAKVAEALRRRISPCRMTPVRYQSNRVCVPVGANGDVPQGQPAERLAALH